MLTILENSCWAIKKLPPPKSNELCEYSLLRARSTAEFEALPKRHAFSFVVDPKNMNCPPAGVVGGNLEQVSDSV
jgi:hypothetical protein